MTPRPGAEFKGTPTFLVESVAELVSLLDVFPLPGFIARGEPREYPIEWLPSISRLGSGHPFADPTPVSGPAGGYSQGELSALRTCQADFLKGGVFNDRYFCQFVGAPAAPIQTDTVNLLHWTALAQHYNERNRYPNRLLDVTTDALVALYFAASTHPDEDGFVFVMDRSHDNDLSTAGDPRTSGVFFDVDRITNASDGGADYVLDDGTLCFMRPPFPNRRIEAQRGGFVWCKRTKESYRRGGWVFRVPANTKKGLLVTLERLNYSNEMLFPT